MRPVGSKMRPNKATECLTPPLCRRMQSQALSASSTAWDKVASQAFAAAIRRAQGGADIASCCTALLRSIGIIAGAASGFVKCPCIFRIARRHFCCLPKALRSFIMPSLSTINASHQEIPFRHLGWTFAQAWLPLHSVFPR